jgi:hypothetical protein
VADGENNVVWILNRDDGSVVGTFGHKGHYAGQFDLAQSIAADSHGNVYVGEVTPNVRVQKFVPGK